MSKNNKNDISLFKNIITEEEETALGILNKNNMIARLRAQLQSGASKDTSIFLFKKQALVFMSLILVLCAGVILLIVSSSNHQEKKYAGVFEKYFQSAPGIQTLMKDHKSDHLIKTEKIVRSYSWENQLVEIFSSINTGSRSADEKTATSWSKKNLEPLDLYERFKMLIIEKRIHRFLSENL